MYFLLRQHQHADVLMLVPVCALLLFGLSPVPWREVLTIGLSLAVTALLVVHLFKEYLAAPLQRAACPSIHGN